MNRIKELRKQKGMTVKELADTLGISQRMLTDCESGISVLREYSIWVKLSRYFEVPIRYLMGLPDEIHEHSLADGLKKIANHYGAEKQLLKLLEELGELTSATSEVSILLTLQEDGGKSKNLQERLIRFAEESADVVNIIVQLLYLFNLTAVFTKGQIAGVDKALKRIEAK